MRIAHLADLHLGFRQYTHCAPNGLNQREVDVARAFEGLIADVIALAPDLVVIAGDVFHTVRPSNPSVLHAFKQLKRLGCPTVIAAGNHDLPRSADAGCILRLFEEIVGVRVADAGAKRIPLGGSCVMAVPDVAGAKLPELRAGPRPYRCANILVLHGEVEGALPASLLHANETIIPVADLHLDEWDYCALGHFHVSTEIAPNCYYSGSIDYTSSNPWGELKEEAAKGLSGKSFIEYDTGTRVMTRHPVRGTRALIDLPPVDADGLSAAEVDAKIAAAVSGASIDDAIVRCVVRELPVTVGRDLSVKAIREYKRRAFHFQIVPERPEHLVGSVQVSRHRHAPLAEMFAARLTKNLEGSDVSVAAVVALGNQYLGKAEEMAVSVEAQ